MNISSPRNEGTDLFHRATLTSVAQWVVVVLCALALKLLYSTASPDQLRWILAPTTLLVELVSGIPFQFESHAGYITNDHTFLIGPSCAGVNFLITSFLLLSLRKLWRDRSQAIAWRFIPLAALCAYLATLVANTVRISTALRLHQTPLPISWLNGNQLHRLEGIFIYFGFLLLLFMLSERNKGNGSGVEKGLAQLQRFVFPLLIYYATTLGVPLANGAYRQGADFWEHAFFVLLIPLIVILPLLIVRLYLVNSVPRSLRDAMFIGRSSPKDASSLQRTETEA